ncbi:DMT family transporter [Salipiger sp. 1_MG-2023]|uniref:DMT family transporter n=1 Tax=Salipiger sp. 1_MG-2023 TaxID=3062665 RepID=UPI0026E28DB9|nr:DMT family transporter [Salipiger sp. 1_MG-2023]MDO6587161.1 DMT family transporter [Salipiger sp. 1_MG-2023]
MILTLALLAIAGSALVLQNAIMLEARTISGSVWVALWLNSAVGLVLLTITALAADGPQAFARLATGRWWLLLLPGLLGTLFVYASLSGYARVGAVLTISTLVAAQIAAGVGFDALRGLPVSGGQMAGLALLLAGVALVIAAKP